MTDTRAARARHRRGADSDRPSDSQVPDAQHVIPADGDDVLTREQVLALLGQDRADEILLAAARTEMLRQQQEQEAERVAGMAKDFQAIAMWRGAIKKKLVEIGFAVDTRAHRIAIESAAWGELRDMSTDMMDLYAEAERKLAAQVADAEAPTTEMPAVTADSAAA